MLSSTLAPYLYWAKTRPALEIDLAGSNLLACTLDDLPGARDAVELTAQDKNGFPPLVEAIAHHYGVGTDAVVTANGCSAANFLAIAALVGPGDAVLMESPGYDQISGGCVLMGARLDTFERRFADGYRLDVNAIRARLTKETRLVIVSTPHNPSGAIADASALHALDQLAAQANAHVLVDEVYLDATNLLLTPAPRGASGVHRPAALMGSRMISTSSLTKSYGLAGLRCGWAVGPPDVIARLRRVRDLLDNIGAAPADRLSALAFATLDTLAARAQRLLAANLRLVRSFLAAHPQLDVAVPPETTIVFPRLQGASDAAAFVETLAGAHGVAVAPGRFFGAPAHVRISLGGRTSALDTGLARIGAALAARE